MTALRVGTRIRYEDGTCGVVVQVCDDDKRQYVRVHWDDDCFATDVWAYTFATVETLLTRGDWTLCPLDEAVDAAIDAVNDAG